MRIETKNAFVKRDLDRLVRQPRYGLRVQRVSDTTYVVNSDNPRTLIIDLGHCVPHLNDATAAIHLG